ncbi:hypothetical protein [Adlercreutzia agrestimuris]|uniref:hypothetical protein n=1 Tax=Adlercreutzia agrestimuris TaxID=2941324 RepID=UPI00203EAEA0|nr:hypothetical protein [Adlercreutzia agrestimuris]
MNLTLTLMTAACFAISIAIATKLSKGDWLWLVGKPELMDTKESRKRSGKKSSKGKKELAYTAVTIKSAVRAAWVYVAAGVTFLSFLFIDFAKQSDMEALNVVAWVINTAGLVAFTMLLIWTIGSRMRDTGRKPTLSMDEDGRLLTLLLAIAVMVVVVALLS